MKVVINVESYGCFEISKLAIKRLSELGSKDAYTDMNGELQNRLEDRADMLLVQVVEELGKKANSGSSRLKMVEIPDDVNWQIGEEEQTGVEFVEEVHRVWQ